MNTARYRLFFALALALLIAFGFSDSVFAQDLPPPPPPPDGDPGCWPPPCIPINKGLVFLAGGALVLGFLKLRSVRREAKA
jgi:hypothetical protein